MLRFTCRHIGVGFATKQHKTTKMPGWESHSWGYHADDGKLFSSEGEQPFGPRFSSKLEVLRSPPTVTSADQSDLQLAM